MRTIKGLPIGIKIGKDITLDDVERLMLRASESHNLSETEEATLLGHYNEIRRKWLDARYELNDEHLKALHDADDRIITATKDTINIVCRTLESEARLPEEERLISGAFVHLEEDGLPMGIKDVHEMSDEEIYLWSLLFGESNREGYRDWGFLYPCLNFHVSIRDCKGWRERCHQSLEQTGKNGLSKLFWNIRYRYGVALQDMARVADFRLTIEYTLK